MKPKGILSLVVAKYIKTIIGIKKIESAKNKIILSIPFLLSLHEFSKKCHLTILIHRLGLAIFLFPLLISYTSFLCILFDNYGEMILEEWLIIRVYYWGY